MPKLEWFRDEIGYRCPACALYVAIPRRDVAWCPRCPDRPKTGAELITDERARQVRVEGWTPEHDALHDGNELVLGAAAYLLQSPALFPWDKDDYWKPTPDDRVRELVKSGALIAAEIDRLQATQ